MVPILRLLHQTVEQILRKEGGGQVNLIGHSAGGWIGRIYLGEQPYCIHGDVDKHANLWGHHSRIATLVTLGTPHSSGERWTRKNLDFVNQNYPGAFYPDVSYVWQGKQSTGRDDYKIGSPTVVINSLVVMVNAGEMGLPPLLPLI
jgi:triacylglycerol esterase/lipase EstA (alpha/beta hydrolase family)